MKRILPSLLVATLPFGGVLADAPKEKNAKVILVYQLGLPNVPSKSIKGEIKIQKPRDLSRDLDKGIDERAAMFGRARQSPILEKVEMLSRATLRTDPQSASAS
jgi:hypothetical protein